MKQNTSHLVPLAHQPIAHSLAEAVRITSLSRSTLERAIRDGALPARHPSPRRVVVLRSDLEAFLRGDAPTR